MESKQQFFNRPRIATLTLREKERRWAQHQASVRSARTPGRTPNTRMVQRQTPKGTLADLMLSQCAKDYFLALGAPFSTKNVACVPDLHSIPSKKVRVKTRGTFSTGADGNGYIACCNWCNDNAGSVVIYSTAALASSTSVLPENTVGTGKATQPKLPYTAAQFEAAGATPGVQARTVAVGLRIRYIGPQSSMSGQITGLRHPDNETLVNLQYNDIRSYTTAKTFRNHRDWIYALWRPVRPDEYHFSKDASTASDGSNFKWETGFTIAGTTDINGAPSPAPFEYEVIRFVEFIGNIDNVTRSHVDLQGMSHIRNSMPQSSTTSLPHKYLAHMAKNLEESAVEFGLPAGMGAAAYKMIGGGTAEAAETAASTGIMDTILGAAATAGASATEFLSGLGLGGLATAAEAAAPLLLL